jgi:hypothetical protein
VVYDIVLTTLMNYELTRINIGPTPQAAGIRRYQGQQRCRKSCAVTR